MPIQHLTACPQGPRLLATHPAKGPAGLTFQKQAPKQASKCRRSLHKLPLACNLALAAHIHRGGFAAPGIPQAAHMGRAFPKGTPIPLYALRQRFITRSAFPVSFDATAPMRGDSGGALPQTCADLGGAMRRCCIVEGTRIKGYRPKDTQGAYGNLWKIFEVFWLQFPAALQTMAFHWLLTLPAHKYCICGCLEKVPRSPPC